MEQSKTGSFAILEDRGIFAQLEVGGLSVSCSVAWDFGMHALQPHIMLEAVLLLTWQVSLKRDSL